MRCLAATLAGGRRPETGHETDTAPQPPSPQEAAGGTGDLPSWWRPDVETGRARRIGRYAEPPPRPPVPTTGGRR